MRFFAVALIFFGVAASSAQTPEVPHKMHFADLTLTIRDDARREIQADVDALTKSPRYFGIKVERAKTYFPIIEKIFEEERVPVDFKYLVLQESALIADAVSVSNAVGFWQFKDFTAMEMGLRVDHEIDERMNIYASTRGAAQYLKKNNYLFNNWLLALQSYQMGGGGVQRSVGDQFNGARHMEITRDTYWYVKKFLAYKVAFEPAVIGEPQVKLIPFSTSTGKSIADLSRELVVEEAILREYNKWIKGNEIPADRTYTLIVPSGPSQPDFTTQLVTTKKSEPVLPVSPRAESDKKSINGIPVIQAKAEETPTQLASRAGISLSDFLRNNDLTIDAKIEPGAYYFLKKKKSRAEALTHTVQPGENLWRISQQYGVQLKRIEKWNPSAKLQPGETVWITSRKPSTTQATVEAETEVVMVEPETFFGWGVTVKEQTRAANPVQPLQPKTTTPPETQVFRKDTTHVVAAKETLYSIAGLYGVAVTDLLTWNKLKIADGLKIGQVLVVKVPVRNEAEASVVAKAVIHEVKGSDTLYSVARQYNVTIKELMEWNKKADFSLAQGEKLTIWPR